ncbi:MAG: hypothetical protein QOD99_2020 [Chthoniobacter sp.]|jgi:hypothetical protein|nr:hypothetical protein [Chthoniobacter sp.]
MNTSLIGYFARVALSFTRKNDTKFIAFTRNVLTLMTGNATCPNPTPSLPTVTDSVDGFETAVHDALNGGRIEIATRNAARSELLALMRQLAAYVQVACNADLLALLSSGFEPVRAPSPVGALPAPQNVRLSLTGVSGEILVRFDRVSNAVNYTAQTSVSVDGPWEYEDPSTSTRVLVEGLTPGAISWFRVCGNGSAGAGAWSSPISAMAV